VWEDIDISKVIDLELETKGGKRISIHIGEHNVAFDISAPEGDLIVRPRAVNRVYLEVERYGDKKK